MIHAPRRRTEGKYAYERNRQKRIISILLILVLVLGGTLSFTACGGKGTGEDQSAPDRDNTPVVLKTEASGEKVFSSGGAKVDYSNTKKGYVMANYSGSNDKVKFQLIAGGETYNYDLPTDGKWAAFPLSEGSGDYTVGIFKNISGDQYSQVLKESFTVKLEDEFQPYLHPNQYVDYTDETNAIALSEKISSGAKSDIGVVEKIYNHTKDNITYDYDKAANVKVGYLPNIDETLDTGKGICFDYASVMVAMLRAQNIPTKLVIGYAGTAYHAWISVYLEDQGWVDAIEIHDNDWTLMDPTFASGGDDSDPNLVGDGEKYNANYYY